MKNMLCKIIVATIFLGSFSLTAEESVFNDDLAKMAQSQPLSIDQIKENASATTKGMFFAECSEHVGSRKAASTQITTYNFYFQNIADGSGRQHVAVYSDIIVATNISGPREGLQLIGTHNGALIDMCHNYTVHKGYCKNKYSWGEVYTYSDHQTIVFY